MLWKFPDNVFVISHIVNSNINIKESIEISTLNLLYPYCRSVELKAAACSMVHDLGKQ